MAYRLGAQSLARLKGVHPHLVAIVQRAIQLTDQDFTVYEGVRTLAKQKLLVASGSSKTLKSMHLLRPDYTGETNEQLGHAVDLVPWIAGEARWEWGGCYAIAAAMGQAADELKHANRLCWGGCWDKPMSAYGDTAKLTRAEAAAYMIRHAGPDFMDGPHYQIGRIG